MDRLINYGMGMVVIYLFVMEGKAEDHGYILAGLFLSIILGFGSFFLNWLTLDATRSVIVLGTIILGFGGWLFSVAVLFFFVSSSLLTRNRRFKGVKDFKKEPVHPGLKERRDSYQVWANGFWMAFFIIGWFIFSSEAWLVAAYGTVAAATADTWATEVGFLHAGKTKIITTGEQVKPGTDGGVSFKGTIAALAGSAAIGAILYLPGGSAAQLPASIVFAGGFLGCMTDSYLGAILQKEDLKTATPDYYSGLPNYFKNNLVNWISTGIGGFITFIFTQILTV